MAARLGIKLFSDYNSALGIPTYRATPGTGICLRCPLDPAICDYSASQTGAITCLPGPPTTGCLRDWALWHKLPMDVAESLAERYLDPDRPITVPPFRVAVEIEARKRRIVDSKRKDKR